MKVNVFLVSLLISLIIFSCQSEKYILTGLDVLEQKEFELLKHRSVGVVTNHTAVNRHGTHLVDLLHENNDIMVKVIFAPSGVQLGDSL